MFMSHTSLQALICGSYTSTLFLTRGPSCPPAAYSWPPNTPTPRHTFKNTQAHLKWYQCNNRLLCSNAIMIYIKAPFKPIFLTELFVFLMTLQIKSTRWCCFTGNVAKAQYCVIKYSQRYYVRLIWVTWGEVAIYIKGQSIQTIFRNFL